LTASSQVYAQGAAIYGSKIVCVGGDAAGGTVEVLSGGSGGNVVFKVALGIGETVSRDLGLVQDGMYVRLTGTDVAAIVVGPPGALVAGVTSMTLSDPVASAGSGSFDGTSGYTDFSEVSTGSGIPTGFTEYGGSTLSFEVLEDIGMQGGQFLRITDAGVFVEWGLGVDAFGSQQYGEVLTRLRLHTPEVGNRWHAGAGMRLTGVTDPTFDAVGSVVYNRGATDVEGAAAKIDNGANGLEPGAVDWQTSETPSWYWVRCRIDDGGGGETRFRTKFWRHDVTEPVAWDADYTSGDAPPTAAGAVGLMCINPNVAQFDVDYIGYTTDPGTAPLSVPAEVDAFAQVASTMLAKWDPDKETSFAEGGAVATYTDQENSVDLTAVGGQEPEYRFRVNNGGSVIRVADPDFFTGTDATFLAYVTAADLAFTWVGAVKIDSNVRAIMPGFFKAGNTQYFLVRGNGGTQHAIQARGLTGAVAVTANVVPSTNMAIYSVRFDQALTALQLRRDGVDVIDSTSFDPGQMDTLDKIAYGHASAHANAFDGDRGAEAFFGWMSDADLTALETSLALRYGV